MNKLAKICRINNAFISSLYAGLYKVPENNYIIFCSKIFYKKIWEIARLLTNSLIV